MKVGGDTIHKFDAFDETRKRQLINAGFTEFGTHGFQRASLNKILKKSNIPKGLFYHYFTQKEDLYQYLYSYGINVITKRLIDSTVLDETDYIKRLIKNYIIKAEVYHEFEHFEQFIMQVYRDDNQAFLKTINVQDSKDYVQRFMKDNIDVVKFRTDYHAANIRVASRYMREAMTDIINRIQNMTIEDIQTYLEQEAQYLKMILYKEEYHD